MPLVLGGSAAVTTAYSIDNSCRFNKGDSPKLYRTPAGDGNLTTWTFSSWFKRGGDMTTQSQIFSAKNSTNTTVMFHQDGHSYFEEYQGGSDMLKTDAIYKDPSAWYHMVYVWDTDNVTSGDTMRTYVNGVRITDFVIETYPAAGLTSLWNSTLLNSIGYITASYADYYMAETVFIDGQALDATSFGEFNEDSPTIWQPKDVSGLTFGTNGFHLDFEDSSALGNDVSGNNNDFTSSGLDAADQAQDSPTNNFCTINPLGGQLANTSNTSWALSEGNCLFTSASIYSQWGAGTFGMTGGKWYWEIITDGTFDGNDNVPYLGVIKGDLMTARQALSSPTATSSDHASVTGKGNLYDFGSDTALWGDTFQNGDLVMIAVDCDNGKLWWGINGTWQKTGTVGIPADGTNPSITFTAGTLLVPYILGWQDPPSANPIKCNFGGCPPFTITSGNADDNGYGNFEYDVPAGFLALCTKNLGSDGG